MRPIVCVIGHTTFRGIPEPLLGDAETISRMSNGGQDRGSEAARLIECAGRTCYDSYGKGRDSSAYHRHILEVGHGSVLEHASISFFIGGVSRGLTHELVRHRAGTAISQRSTRYVDESTSEWAFHPLIDQFVGMLNADDGTGEALMVDIFDVKKECDEMYDVLVERLQTYLVKNGADKQTARKQARGAARGILGNALCTELVWTANIRAIRNIIEQRASPHADAEIRVLANRIYEEAIGVCPEYFSDYIKSEPCADGIGYALTTPYRKV